MPSEGHSGDTFSGGDASALDAIVRMQQLSAIDTALRYHNRVAEIARSVGRFLRQAESCSGPLDGTSGGAASWRKVPYVVSITAAIFSSPFPPLDMSRSVSVAAGAHG